MPDLGPYLRREQCRERIIDAALPMWAASGYESTTTKQAVAAAGLAPDRFEDYFRSKDAVVLAVLDDMLQGTATALRDVGAEINPEQALLTATVDALSAIVNGRRATTAYRLVCLAQVLRAQPDLRRQASTARKQAIAEALAERLGVDATDATVRLATTKWSAVASAAYSTPGGMGPSGRPRVDKDLTERMTAELAAAFLHVTGRFSEV
jgi:AcrR family transcriptional regulator